MRALRLGAAAMTTVAEKAGGSNALMGTPSAAHSLHKSQQPIAVVDEALAKFIAKHDLPWSAFCSRDPLWVKVVDSIKAAPFFKPAPAEHLSEYRDRGEGSRAGGRHPNWNCGLGAVRAISHVHAGGLYERGVGYSDTEDGAGCAFRSRVAFSRAGTMRVGGVGAAATAVVAT